MLKQTHFSNLPLELSSFIGRIRETADVQRLLDESRLLTLTGAGGCGKTRLAWRVATDLANNFADGVCWVDLAPLNDAALVPQSVAKTLNLTEQSRRTTTESILDFLCDKERLLVLDNCEHLLTACAELVQNILREVADIRILASSREPLAVTGETLYPVSPLALPPSNQLANLEQFDAIRLFVERAHQVLPNFALNANNARIVAEICGRLDGILLAIDGERALNLIREINHPFGLGMSLIQQGNNAAALGRFETAHKLLEEGLQIAQQSNDTMHTALAFNYLGDLARCEGNFARAQSNYENSLARYREIDSKRELAGTTHNLAYAVLHQNQVDSAADLFKQSLQMHQSLRNQPGMVECLTGFAAVAVQQKKFDQAARLPAYSTKLGSKEASAIWAGERMEYASVELAIQKQLSSQQWRAAQLEIQNWSMVQAIEYALGLTQIKIQTAASTAGLSARELEIIALVADGKSNIEIADQLVLSKRTVEKHVANILGKLDFTNRTQVARWATENKLTQPKK